MRFLPGNAQHIGARQSQQDSFGFTDPDDAAFISHAGFLAIVCDGMGGMEHGDAASRTAVRAFLDAYLKKSPAESIPSALERSVHAANEQVLTLARSMGMVEGIGTTLVAAALQDSAMYYISVGDSGLFYVSGGQAQMINRPHVFANMLDLAVARGQMTRDAALNHPERESLTSYIGAETLEEIDHNLEPFPMHDGETILIASDGMFKTLESDEISGCLRGNAPSWPDRLVNQTLAKKREFQDNVTVVSVTLESEARAAVPRTVLMAPPPPSVAGVPAELPRTVMLPMEPGSRAPVVTAPPPPPPTIPPPAMNAIPHSPVATTLPPEILPPPPEPLRMNPPSGITIPAPQRRSGIGLFFAGILLASAAGGGWWWWTHRAPNPVGTGTSATHGPANKIDVPQNGGVRLKVPPAPSPIPDPQPQPNLAPAQPPTGEPAAPATTPPVTAPANQEPKR